MSEEEYRSRGEKDEKEEKGDEKERAKHDMWSPGDALGPVVWGLVIIFAGLVLVAANLGTFPWLTWGNAWPVIFLGAGLLFLLEVVIRLLIPAYRRPLAGRLILAFVAFAIGAGGYIGWELTWPLILLGIGLVIILGVLLRSRL